MTKMMPMLMLMNTTRITRRSESQKRGGRGVKMRRRGSHCVCKIID